MNTKPILMSGEMVLALLAGRKTQTRRAIKPQPPQPIPGGVGISWQWWGDREAFVPNGTLAGMSAEMKSGIRCPHGRPGDHLWVKETFRLTHKTATEPKVIYRADDPTVCGAPWRPSIYMPRWASRITLEIVSVRPERLQDITEEDAEDEGIEGRCHPEDAKLWTWKDYRRSKRFNKPIFHYSSAVTRVSTYAGLWESINGPGSWDENPWVWKIEFKRV